MKLYDLFTESTVDEVAMNPGAFAAAVTQGQQQGVLVGFEFEVLVPKETLNKKEKVIDQKAIQKIFNNTGFWDDLSPHDDNDIKLEKFDGLFTLRPGITPKYASLAEALNVITSTSLDKIKETFYTIPERVRKEAIAIVKRNSHRGFENTPKGQLDFARAFGGYVYRTQKGAIESAGSRIYNLGADIDWSDVLGVYLGINPLSINEKFTKYFDYDPQLVYKALNLSDHDEDEYGDDWGRGYDYENSAKVLKPAVQRAFGRKVKVFNDYHEQDKNLKDWYIEPDGSLSPDQEEDGAAEIVSPPMNASEAMSALKNFYAMAQQLNLYTNNSTGLHINISIPQKLDILKLAVFLGDQYVLKQFGRDQSSYAVGAEKHIKQVAGTSAGKTTNIDYNKLQRLAQDATNAHTASISNNGKYISFRHAGGDYLSDYAMIANTVGRFIRAMLIAADPNAYAKEYQIKLSKLTQRSDVPAETDISAYIRKTGLPAYKISLWLTGRSKLETMLRYLGLGKFTVYKTEVNSEAAKQAIVNGFQRPSRKQAATEAPVKSFVTITLVPSNEQQIKNILSYREQGVNSIEHSWNTIGYGLIRKDLIPPTDPISTTVLKQILQSRYKK